METGHSPALAPILPHRILGRVVAAIAVMATPAVWGQSQASNGDTTVVTSPSSLAGGGRTMSADGSIISDVVLGIPAADDDPGGGPGAEGGSGFSIQMIEPVGVRSIALPDGTPTGEVHMVNEDATTQFAAQAEMDDGSFTPVNNTEVAWTGLTDGLFSPLPVLTDSQLMVGLQWEAFSSDFQLLIADSDPDNFGPYAADGIDDSWQDGFFNATPELAGPEADPDADGNGNLLEFLAGLNPTDPASVFQMRVEPVPGDSGKRQIIFSPLATARDYRVLGNTTLNPANWAVLTDFSVNDDSGERTITDLNPAPLQFYRVEIIKLD